MKTIEARLSAILEKAWNSQPLTRDNSSDTTANRGMDVGRCRKMMFECGFDYLRRGDESKIPLTFDYLIQTDSL